jgi:DNA-directed RNA polymerase subunit RPC12/RpoP
MTHKTVAGECLECESTYVVDYVTELTSDEMPEYCPFCGNKIEDFTEEFSEEDELDDPEQEW